MADENEIVSNPGEEGVVPEAEVQVPEVPAEVVETPIEGGTPIEGAEEFKDPTAVQPEANPAE